MEPELKKVQLNQARLNVADDAQRRRSPAAQLWRGFCGTKRRDEARGPVQRFVGRRILEMQFDEGRPRIQNPDPEQPSELPTMRNEEDFRTTDLLLPVTRNTWMLPHKVKRRIAK